ncbi:MAG TPA: glycine cleavage T C-terminal barrel domain-containing protein [Acidimicrobiales bacterium]
MTAAGDAASVPIDQPDFVEAYERLRTDVAAVAVQRDVLRVSGVDALEYLQGQLSQDVAALGVGESADSLILTPQGKLDALVRVSRTGDEELVLDVDGGFGAVVAARLARFKMRVKADIEPLAWRCVTLRGPRAAAVAGSLLQGAPSGETGPRSVAAVFSWNGVSGVDLLGEAPDIPAGVRAGSIEAWEAVRVEAGIPIMGAELDERTIAAEADLLERCVSFTKGCYTGQELVARLDARGNRVTRHLRGLVVVGLGADAPGPVDLGAGSPVAPGSEILFEGKVVGSVTSSAWSPRLGHPVALGYVHRTVAAPSTVELSIAGDAGGAGGAGQRTVVTAEVRTLPLA